MHDFDQIRSGFAEYISTPAAIAVLIKLSAQHCQLKETVLKTLPLNFRVRACMGPGIPLRARKPLARDISLPPGGEISALPALS